MPLVRIEIYEGRGPEEVQQLADIVHEAAVTASNCQYLLIGERRADSVRTPGQYRTAGRSIHRLGVRSVGVSFA